MKTFAVIGHPLDHTISPTLHNYIFNLLALDAHYKVLEIQPQALNDVARQLRKGRLAGINITLPYKTAFLSLLDKIAPATEAVGAVNCVTVDHRELMGYNTDVTGILYALEQGGVETKGASALIIGSGGAARAAIVALMRVKASRICIAGRREKAISRLLNDFRKRNSDTVLEAQLLSPDLDTKTFQLMLNATPVGMWPHVDASPLQQDHFQKDQTILDLVYRPEKTLFLHFGENQGCRCVSGLEMFIGQGLASLELWFPGRIYDRTGNLNSTIELSAIRTLLSAALDNRTTTSRRDSPAGVLPC